MKRVVTKFGMTMLRTVFGAALIFGLSAAASSAQTLKKVQDRGSLICGVSQGLPGFSNPDDKGTWTGLDVDVCRAVAAAIFNDPAKVKFLPLSAKDRFTALQSGEIDVLSFTWSGNQTYPPARELARGSSGSGKVSVDGATVEIN